MAKEKKIIQANLLAIKNHKPKTGVVVEVDQDKIKAYQKSIEKLEARIRKDKSQMEAADERAKRSMRSANHYDRRAKKAAKAKDFAKNMRISKESDKAIKKAIDKNKNSAAFKIAEKAHDKAVKQLAASSAKLAKAKALMLKLRAFKFQNK